jgi:hydroxymethylbilane synthase
VPIGAWCLLGEHGLHLRGMVGDAGSGRLLRAEASGSDPLALGHEVARQLLAQGAGDLLGL